MTCWCFRVAWFCHWAKFKVLPSLPFLPAVTSHSRTSSPPKPSPSPQWSSLSFQSGCSCSLLHRSEPLSHPFSHSTIYSPLLPFFIFHPWPAAIPTADCFFVPTMLFPTQLFVTPNDCSPYSDFLMYPTIFELSDSLNLSTTDKTLSIRFVYAVTIFIPSIALSAYFSTQSFSHALQTSSCTSLYPFSSSFHLLQQSICKMDLLPSYPLFYYHRQICTSLLPFWTPYFCLNSLTLIFESQEHNF